MTKETKIILSALLAGLCSLLLYCSSKVSSGKIGNGNTTSETDSKAEIEKVIGLANAFKKTLTAEQVKILQLPYSKADAAKWSNFPQAASHPQRVGISFRQLNAEQMTAAKTLMAAILDNKTLNEGYNETEGIWAADDKIATLPGKNGFFGSGNYFIAFLGEPSTTGLWELQFGGHHLAVSNTYKEGKLIAMTPSFRGVEPITDIEANGKHYQPMEQERMAFKSIISGLSPEQLQTAKLPGTYSDILLGPGRDASFPTTKQGVKVGLLPTAQQEMVLQAIRLYVKDLQSGKTEQVLNAYKNDLADTYIAYAGNTSLDKAGDYFRIDGPGVWIEYNTQQSRDFPPTHPHSVWRDHRSDYGGQ